MRTTATCLVLLLVVSCGVPRDGEIEVVDAGAVPFGLLDEDPATAGEAEGAATLQVFLVTGDPGTLVPVSRGVDGPTLAAVLDALAEGPTEAEAALGLRSPVGDGDVLAGAALEGGVATVDLTEDLSSLSGTDQLLAIAQVVLSLTARPGVGRVAFTLEGERVEVPRGDGSLTSGSVSRDTYLSLVGDGAAGSPAASPGGSVGDMVTGA